MSGDRQIGKAVRSRYARMEHPGSYIREEMEARGWLQRDLAFILGCKEQIVNMILSGKRGISADMARALGEAFDVPAEFFANLQRRNELESENERLKATVTAREQAARDEPYDNSGGYLCRKCRGE